jgi:hypothetical protein
MPPPAVLFAGLMFSLVGMVAFTYGRKQGQWQQMVIGIALIAFPYFVSETWLLYAIGVGLCAALILWRN